MDHRCSNLLAVSLLSIYAPRTNGKSSETPGARFPSVSRFGFSFNIWTVTLTRVAVELPFSHVQAVCGRVVLVKVHVGSSVSSSRS